MTRSTTTIAAAIGLLGVLMLGAWGSPPGFSPSPTPGARVVAARATTSDQQDRGSFSVDYDVFAPAAIVLAPSCDSAGQCALPYSNTTATLTGDIGGTAVGAGSAVIGTDFASSVANAIVTGTIAPCGSGTFVMRYFVVYDLHDVSAGRPGTWQIVPGLGSGDLASLTGNGTFTITQTNPDLSNLSAWRGRVRCGTNDQD